MIELHIETTRLTILDDPILQSSPSSPDADEEMESWRKRISSQGKLVDIGNLLHDIWLHHTRIFPLVIVIVISTFALFDLYLCYFVTSVLDGSTLPLSLNSSDHPCYSSPFCTINVKNLMLDPPDFYVHNTLSSLFVLWADLGNSYLFITPNMISFFHVFVALMASRLISNDSLCVRRIGVLLFQFRNFLDAVDGVIARERRKTVALASANLMIMNQTYSSIGGTDNNIYYPPPDGISMDQVKEYKSSESLGYWVDGICDGVGGIFLYLACYFYLQRHPVRRRSLFSYTAIPLIVSPRNGAVSSTHVSKKKRQKRQKKLSASYLSRQIIRSVHRYGFLSINYGFQALLGSIAWNRFIPNYTKLLETNASNFSSHETQMKGNLVTSPIMWMVILAWRYVNPHTWVEILLIAIFFDRTGEFLYAFRIRGFLVVIAISMLTEAHLRYARSLF
ncbi:ceramide phosphoethanolamine synthase isoform X2 [Folsomia candida]|uniref:Ceramide phosphoethanolamine synthase n=1 Tax=Folsomia candida TaxID=158441 RepID=A0A226E7Y0_FOLCA|nr:ceramide phosphoethanolamine synthase isoform X2 [Folsomia candida]OXA52766.1 Ceramide phosphoethanolamine synthase [Folsomia candida]